jgi:SpoVK/Ycf46/Vps4 family AAA+-type ATPase
MPPLSPEVTTLFRVRLFDLIGQLVRDYELGPFEMVAGYNGTNESTDRVADSSPEFENEPKDGRHAGASEDAPKKTFPVIDPLFRWDQLVLPDETSERLLDCIAILEVAPIVFESWNLRSIEPHPSLSLNFRGPPGTGKTMAAHAIANRMGKQILLSRLSDLESKFHGDGPKNLVQLFQSASQEKAVLFIDEAESLLSRRFAQPDQASESAINSMRTELFMAIDSFDGLVIFATNLADSYDNAAESRLLHVDFSLPDLESRKQIWSNHLPLELPLSEEVSIPDLAQVEGVSGRDIKAAVIAAATATARRGESVVSRERLVFALEQQLSRPATSVGTPNLSDHNVELTELSPTEREELGATLRQTLQGQPKMASSGAMDTERFSIGGAEERAQIPPP